MFGKTEVVALLLSVSSTLSVALISRRPEKEGGILLRRSQWVVCLAGYGHVLSRQLGQKLKPFGAVDTITI